MIQLRKSHVVADRKDIERWKVEFQEKHCVLLPKLLEPPLLDVLLERLEQGHWCDKVHEGIGIEVVLEDSRARGLLHFVVNAPAFLSTVQEITGCGPLTQFRGRIYRFIPDSGHHDSWHNDDGNGLVGLSLNLSPRGYEGGVFQLREWSSKRILAEIANTGWGDATLFRISRQLDHQVTDVIGANPKTAFAGWFKSGDPNPFAGMAGRCFDRLGTAEATQRSGVQQVS